MSNPKVLYTFNNYHLGDNIYCCIMFSKIKEYIESNKIFIKHYCQPEYIEQVREFVYSNNISIHPLNELPENDTNLNIWIGTPEYPYNFFRRNHYIRRNNLDDNYFNVFLMIFYNQVLKMLQIPIEINHFSFDELDFLEREKMVNERTNNAFNSMDFLFVNGAPQSGQVEYNKTEWDDIIRKFSEKYKIVTTQKIEGILCTRDFYLTAKDIASIGKNAKKIIAIDSGVSIGLYNKYVFQNVEVVYYIGTNDINFSNFKYAKHIRDLQFLL